MDRDQIVAMLRAHEGELRAAGIAKLALFGSVARGESGVTQRCANFMRGGRVIATKACRRFGLN